MCSDEAYWIALIAALSSASKGEVACSLKVHAWRIDLHCLHVLLSARSCSCEELRQKRIAAAQLVPSMWIDMQVLFVYSTTHDIYIICVYE